MERAEKLREQIVRALQKGNPTLALSMAEAMSYDEQPAAIHHLVGLAHIKLEQLEPALDRLRRAASDAENGLTYAPELADLLIQTAQFDEAIALCGDLTRRHPTQLSLWDALARAHVANGDFSRAANAYQRATELDPTNVDTWCNLAISRKKSGQVSKAASAWRNAEELDPRGPRVTAGLGAMHLEAGDYQAAENYLELARGRDPQALEPILNLAMVWFQQKRHTEALSLLEELEQSDRESMRSQYIRALALHGSDDPNALHALMHAASQSAMDSASIASLCRIITDRGRAAEATDILLSHRSSRPDDGLIAYSLGSLYLDLGRFEKAEEHLRAATEHDPSLSDAWFNLGQALRAHNQWREARSCFERALECNPDFVRAKLAAALTLPVLYLDEDEVVETRSAFEAGLNEIVLCEPRASEPDLQPWVDAIGSRTNFQLAYQGLDDCTLQRQYGQWVSGLMQRSFGDRPIEKSHARVRIRVGFVSSFWWHHTVGKLFRGWIEKLDSSQFDIRVYHVGKRRDELTAAIEASADGYLSHSSWQAMAEAIEAECPDILIYPEVGMDSTTLQLAALRLAPAQCGAWGHPITTGLPTMDYFLTSDLMEPGGTDASYSESLVRLPKLSITYRRPTLPKLTLTRAELNLPEERTLYLCCQSLFKYLPTYDDTFARIIEADPDGHLVFIENKSARVTQTFRERLSSIFEESGVNFDSAVSFVPQLQFEAYLQLNGLADVYLDSIGWSGGNTTLEALAWGTPMVTFRGQWMRGCHSAAVLEELGLAHWIADSPEKFVELATRLGKDQALRESVRKTIRERSSDIYDNLEPVRALEAFILEVVQSKTE